MWQFCCFVFVFFTASSHNVQCEGTLNVSSGGQLADSVSGKHMLPSWFDASGTVNSRSDSRWHGQMAFCERVEFIWGEWGHGTRWVTSEEEQFIPPLIMRFIAMRCLRVQGNSSDEGTNSSRSLQHHQGLGAVRADDGDNLFLLGRSPRGNSYYPHCCLDSEASAIRNALAALQGNVRVYIVRGGLECVAMWMT